MTKRQFLLILLVALAVRLAYQQLVPVFDGSYDNGSDSGRYIDAAQSIRDHGSVVRITDGEARPDFERLPLYPHFVAGVFWLAGDGNLAAVTAIQAVISALTVFAVALIAGALDRRWMIPAALLASFWPAFVVYTSWVLTDSLFVDFFTWGLCACIWAARRHRPASLLIAAGFLFGLALLTRPVLMFFPYLLVPALAYLLIANHQIGWRRALRLAVIPAAIMMALLSPRLVATYTAYGVPVVTTQSGNHALELAYPCFRNDLDCDRASVEQRRFELVAAGMEKLTEEERANPVLVDAIRRRVALHLLTEVPPGIFVLAVADSAFRSIAQTMLYEVGHQLNLNPKFFSAVQGVGIREKLTNFLSSMFDNPFMLIWASAQLAALIAIPIQVVGLVAGVSDPARRSTIIFLGVTAGYFLAVNLTFGNPKYGIPLNPAQIVLLVAGAQVAVDWYRGTGRATFQPAAVPRATLSHRRRV